MVMIVRQSGNPVDREEQGKFAEEWKKDLISYMKVKPIKKL